MIDNFARIEPILNLEEGFFYFVQIIRRAKEDKELGSNNRVVKSYLIATKEEWDSHVNEIKRICFEFHARAYINLNRRQFKQIALECLRHNAEIIADQNYKGIKSSRDHIIGKHNGELPHLRTWIVDIDSLDPPLEMIEFINAETLPRGGKCLFVVPTKNGMHLITKPFDLSAFAARYPNIDVHKNNPTLLLCPF